MKQLIAHDTKSAFVCKLVEEVLSNTYQLVFTSFNLYVISLMSQTHSKGSQGYFNDPGPVDGNGQHQML
jgi:hypothetical protein